MKTAVRSLSMISQRSFTTTLASNIFYRGTRRKVDEQRKELIEQSQKASKEVFKMAEMTTLEEKREKGRETFDDAIYIYFQRQGRTRRGHVEFILSAIEKMKEYNVNRDLETYKTLFRIFPEKKMVAKSVWQSEFMHFPKQQDCAITILQKMEDNYVVPDDELAVMILNTFGMESHVMAKYQRMMYWMPKLLHTNPWPVKFSEDRRTTSQRILKRMTMDHLSEVTVHETRLIPDVAVDTYIASSQSPDQRSLLALHDKSKPIYVEGPFTSWFGEKQLSYFILRADQDEEYWRKWQEHKKHLQETNYEFSDDTYKWWFNFIQEDEVYELRHPTVHEQEEGIVFAMAVVGENSMESLRAWMRILTIDNPSLYDASVVFRVNFPDERPESIESGRTEEFTAVSG